MKSIENKTYILSELTEQEKNLVDSILINARIFHKEF